MLGYGQERYIIFWGRMSLWISTFRYVINTVMHMLSTCCRWHGKTVCNFNISRDFTNWPSEHNTTIYVLSLTAESLSVILWSILICCLTPWRFWVMNFTACFNANSVFCAILHFITSLSTSTASILYMLAICFYMLVDTDTNHCSVQAGGPDPQENCCYFCCCVSRL